MTLRFRGKAFPRISIVCACRIEGPPVAYADAGVPFKQSDFSTITYSVFDTAAEKAVDNNGTLYSGLPLAISAVIFDTLQSWSEDSRGCNFLLTVGPDAFPQSLAAYQVEVVFVLADGRKGFAAFDVPTARRWSS